MDLVNQFYKLGLRQGDCFILHSSLRSIGYIEGGADIVIDAILEVVGPKGTLMVPTFTPRCSLFDVCKTPSEMGLITETLRRRPQAFRSWHPTHSVAAIGYSAEDLTRNHLNHRALGKGSPIDRLAKMGGYVLLLGVGHDVNSTIHVGEAWAEVGYINVEPYRGAVSEAIVTEPNGQQIHTRLFQQPGHSEGFVNIEPILRERGVLKYGKIGNAKVQLMRAQVVIDAVVELLNKKPDALLCKRIDCEHCQNSRAELEKLRLLP